MKELSSDLEQQLRKAIGRDLQSVERPWICRGPFAGFRMSLDPQNGDMQEISFLMSWIAIRGSGFPEWTLFKTPKEGENSVELTTLPVEDFNLKSGYDPGELEFDIPWIGTVTILKPGDNLPKPQ
jgi:hypothetical protein